MKTLLSWFSLLCLSLLSLAASAGTLQVENAWARESPPGVTNGAAYMILNNQGKDVDRLVGVSGDVAQTIELHTHLLEGNVMKMRPVTAIEVNPGEPTVLRPGGLHIMLIGLKQPLVAGQRFTLNLQFEKAGTVAVPVQVSKTGPEMPHQGPMHSH